MKMAIDYLVQALDFERMAAGATDAAFKEALLNQAAAYRKLAAERAAGLALPLPPDPKPD
jgi:hypothetical protein